MEIDILKCHGSANDFVLIDEFDGEIFDEPDRPLLARLICDRSGALGSDGVLFVQKSDKATVRMRMFNPDGSEPQTCGNGLRCVARFAAERLSRNEITIETMKGISAAAAEAEISPGVRTYSVELGPFSTRAKDLPLSIGSDTLINGRLTPLSERLAFTAVSAPNPHLIALVDKIDRSELEELGNRASQLPEILPEKANVSLCRIIDRRTLAVATFERGAGLTLSCGSAMAASTLVACMLEHGAFGEWISVFNRGGFIHARATKGAGGDYRVFISGNATFVFSAKIELDLEKQMLAKSPDYLTNSGEISAYSKVQRSGEEKMKQAER
jgi:diaminopimelate epimerase